MPIRESLVTQRTALRRQREFAADASHELRTPLTVIRSSVEHLRRSGGKPEATTEALDDIDVEVGQMTALVEDLLLLARSDSGRDQPQPTAGRPGRRRGRGRRCARRSSPAIAACRLGLDPEPAMVRGDQARLRQLIVILVDNAVRHTPRGGSVLVRVRGDRQEVTVDVDDDGPGIRPEDMPKVFDRFWRAPGQASGGTGLGLAIAKSIVDLHDGRITVSNRPEGGARFTVRLPAAEPPAGRRDRDRPGARSRRSLNRSAERRRTVLRIPSSTMAEDVVACVRSIPRTARRDDARRDASLRRRPVLARAP